MIYKHSYGFWAEAFAMIYLMILKRMIPLKLRYRNKFGEIDLIFYKNRTFIFVEVKARKDSSYFDHGTIVKLPQQKRIIRTANYFMQPYLAKQNYFMRFDVIIIKSFWEKPLHYSNVWLKDR